MLQTDSIARVRSLLQSTKIMWDVYDAEIKSVVVKILGLRSETKLFERLSLLESINECLPEASRCAYSSLQEEKIWEVSYPLQKVKTLNLKKAVEINEAPGELLQYYRECWKRFEKWEKSQNQTTKIKKKSLVGRRFNAMAVSPYGMALSYAPNPETNPLRDGKILVLKPEESHHTNRLVEDWQVPIRHNFTQLLNMNLPLTDRILNSLKQGPLSRPSLARKFTNPRTLDAAIASLIRNQLIEEVEGRYHSVSIGPKRQPKRAKVVLS
jgi:hypothetical protein